MKVFLFIKENSYYNNSFIYKYIYICIYTHSTRKVGSFIYFTVSFCLDETQRNHYKSIL